MKILFLCAEGNSCRTLMAEAFLQKMDDKLEVFSAGIHPDRETDPLAIAVMKEIDIDISDKRPQSYRQFEGQEFDYLITLCDGTRENVPETNIVSRHKIHLGFENPRSPGYPERQTLEIYRDVRDEIKNELEYFYSRVLSHELGRY